MGKRLRSTIYCSAVNCSNNKIANPKLSFHRFPSDLARCREWVQNCRRLDLMNRTPEYLSKNCHICSSHFEPEFLPKFCNTRTRLARNAKPTLFNVPNPPPLIFSFKRAPPFRQKAYYKRKLKLMVKAMLADHAYAKRGPEKSNC